MQTVIKAPYVDIQWHEDHQVISCEWITNPSSKELHDAMEAELDAVRKHSCGRLFFDPTHLGAVSPEDQAWLFGTFIQEVVQSAGSCKIANVVPTDIFTQMSLDEVLKEGPQTSFQYFDSKEKALQWLAS